MAKSIYAYRSLSIDDLPPSVPPQAPRTPPTSKGAVRVGEATKGGGVRPEGGNRARGGQSKNRVFDSLKI